MAVQMLYFAWVREMIGMGAETVDIGDAVTVADLLDRLSADDAHASAFADRSRLRAAVDQQFVALNAPIIGAREIAIFPPGDGRMIRVAVQQDAIDLAGEIAGIDVGGAGAVATFSGHVRGDDGVATLELEHYPGMTEAALQRLATEAQARWALLAVTIVHRVGRMVPGERIVLVATAAPHRGDALAACTALIDQLKTNAPFWKRETRGTEQRWVEHRATDGAAARRWD